MKNVKSIVVFLILAVTLVMVPGNAYAAPGCMGNYMAALEDCYHTADAGDRFVCFFDADMNYYGCLKDLILW